MRGGTSKGIYFLLRDLPAEDDARNALILKLVGGDARQVNGLGGGDMLNAKVAVVSPAEEEHADIEYRFVQVVPGESRVDTGPTCGNILAGVGAFAIEQGLVSPADGETTVLVRDVNTGARVQQVVQTPGGKVQYDGDCAIAGAPGMAAPVRLYYLDFAGNKTGHLFSTGNKTDTVDGISVSCVDAAMPIVIAPAEAFDLAGDETPADLQGSAAFMQKLEQVRLQAAEAMGMGDARGRVIPKFALVSAPRAEGVICARYFTPVTAHAAMAVSGGIAIGTAALSAGTVAAACARIPQQDEHGDFPMDIEHPSGVMRVGIQLEDGVPVKAGVLRTTRLIMAGEASLAGL